MVNLKRGRRLCREHGLLLRAKRRRKRRGIGAGVPCRAEYPDHVWAYDFVLRLRGGPDGQRAEAAGADGRRRVHAGVRGGEAGYRMNAKFVAGALRRLFRERACPSSSAATTGRSSSPDT